MTESIRERAIREKLIEAMVRAIAISRDDEEGLDIDSHVAAAENALNAALHILSTPTPEMVEAGDKFHFGGYEPSGEEMRQATKDIWTAMLSVVGGGE